jgi:hypothetical protein
MAELTADPSPPTSSCCSVETQASCCEPSDKAACCGGSATGGSCGCSAGQRSEATAVHDIRETVRERYAQAARAAHELAGSAMIRARKPMGRTTDGHCAVRLPA